jgi:hypothetical protein
MNKAQSRLELAQQQLSLSYGRGYALKTAQKRFAAAVRRCGKAQVKEAQR